MKTFNLEHQFQTNEYLEAPTTISVSISESEETLIKKAITFLNENEGLTSVRMQASGVEFNEDFPTDVDVMEYVIYKDGDIFLYFQASFDSSWQWETEPFNLN